MVVCWPRISRLAPYYNKSFAGRGSTRLALKVVCWLKILKVAVGGRLVAEGLGAESRLLAEDLGGWRCKSFAGT